MNFIYFRKSTLLEHISGFTLVTNAHDTYKIAVIKVKLTVSYNVLLKTQPITVKLKYSAAVKALSCYYNGISVSILIEYQKAPLLQSIISN